jgi:hypothetical protein
MNTHISTVAGGGNAWIYPEYRLAATPASAGLYFAGLALR